MSKDAVRNGSAVVEGPYLEDYEMAWGRWHRSNDRKAADHPFASYMLNKKWSLEEEFYNHMMRFQQVTVHI